MLWFIIVLIGCDHSYATVTASPLAQTKSDLPVSAMPVTLTLHSTQMAHSISKLIAFCVHGHPLKETKLLKDKDPAMTCLVTGP